MISKLIVATSISITWVKVAKADPGGNFSRGFDHMMWGGAFGMIGGFFMLLFLGVLIAMAIVLSRSFLSGKSGSNTEKARDILNQRLAKGEIDEEEYLKRLSILEN